jgi:hypothetical protein
MVPFESATTGDCSSGAAVMTGAETGFSSMDGGGSSAIASEGTSEQTTSVRKNGILMAAEATECNRRCSK